MSDSTVEVTVKLPKPPEGYSAWEADENTPLRFSSENSWVTEMRFISRRIAPPERMVQVEMQEATARQLDMVGGSAKYSSPENKLSISRSLAITVGEAARKALAAQQVPDEDVCAFRGCTFPATSLLGGVGPLCDHHDSLILSKQKYEIAQQEVCGVKIYERGLKGSKEWIECPMEFDTHEHCDSCQVIPKGHAGAHSPVIQQEVCQEELAQTLMVSNCQLPKDHAGEHSHGYTQSK